MIHFLSGNDPYLISLKRRGLQESFLAEHPDGEVTVYDFEDERSEKEIARILEESEGGLFGSPKLAIILQASLLGEAALEYFFQELTVRASQAAWLLVEPALPKKATAFSKLIKTLPHEALMANVPSENEARKLIHDKLSILASSGQAVSLSPEAERLFIARVGRDSARLFTELEKLAAFQGEGVVTKESVELLLKEGAEDTAFQALDALASGDRKRATLLFRNAQSAKESALPLLGLCAWQLRQLLLVREAYDQGNRQPQAIAQAAGVAPFVAGKLLRLIGSFPRQRSEQGLRLLAEYDADIKQGAMAPDMALDLFLWKL